MSPCPPGTTNWTLPGTTEVEVVMGAASESVVQYRTEHSQDFVFLQTHTTHLSPTSWG